MAKIGFNEAAAFHRGEPRDRVQRRLRDLRASMRPRLFTAENCSSQTGIAAASRSFNEAAAFHRGERCAGSKALSRIPCFNEAAAFHRGEPLPSQALLVVSRSFNEAAAFHRGEPASCAVGYARTTSFNEAAAFHRGERGDILQGDRDLAASMRQRLFTAENPRSRGHLGRIKCRFNEAAAFHRGEPSRAENMLRRARSFNEAAAFHRGELIGLARCPICGSASMRPRLFTAENPGAMRRSRPSATASMRPRLFTAENITHEAMPAATTFWLQ